MQSQAILRLRRKLAAALILLGVALGAINSFAGDIADTPENRHLQAERYLTAMPMQTLLEDMANKIAANLPESKRAEFVRMFSESVDMDAMNKAVMASMEKHFTANELAALADFYGSPVGKSAMSKFGAYMADVMPTIQSEMIKAQSKLRAPAATE